MKKDSTRDFEYFAKLWDDNRMQDGENASKHWNNRADSWGALLESDSAFKRSLTERVTKTAKYLREHGLLGADDCVIYALFNLLWLCGYYPKTCYHRQNYDNMVPADDELAEFYEWSIFRDIEKVYNAKRQIYEYLQKKSDNGLIRQPVKRWYGWTLWDVREKDDRR